MNIKYIKWNDFDSYDKKTETANFNFELISNTSRYENGKLAIMNPNPNAYGKHLFMTG